VGVVVTVAVVVVVVGVEIGNVEDVADGGVALLVVEAHAAEMRPTRATTTTRRRPFRPPRNRTVSVTGCQLCSARVALEGLHVIVLGSS
jgi:hypothetical protein